MASSLLKSLIGAASMAAALLVGCGDNDQKPTTSKAGESCVRTSDCSSGLICVANVCYKTAPPTGGQAGQSSVPVGPTLGGEGESCNSRRDCTEGLGCFNNRCTTAAAMGEAGATGGTGIHLGVRGESCRVNGDCSKSLVCVPSNVAGTNICDLADFGVEPGPSTKKCEGECLTADDCCQLPLAQHFATATSSIKSCEDIAAEIAAGDVDCEQPAAGVPSKLCFLQSTYCECAKNTWSCSKSNTCVYTNPCVVGAGFDVLTGCPSFSRLNSLATLSCNAKKCIGPAAPAAGCTTDASCEGRAVADSVALTPDLCTGDECTCYAGNKACYRKCARDIDCAAGKVCDIDESELCIPAPTCVTDEQCAISRGSLAFKCNEGTCAETCETDRDCSGTGLKSTFNGRVCGSDHFCATVANDCTDETQCAPIVPGGLKPFCVPSTAGAPLVVSSAVTD